MNIVDVIQGSEEWEEVRRGIPTASRFGSIITPAKGDLSTASTKYMCELVADIKHLSMPAPPTFWMEWGTEQEPHAARAYEHRNGVEARAVGFVFPDGREDVGASPDRLLGDDGLLEIKCPKPETLIEYHLDGVFPKQYKPQVQGQLFVTGLQWCDFFAFHPRLDPFQIRVERDEEYIEKIAAAVDQFTDQLAKLRSKIDGSKPPVEQILDFSGAEVVQL